MRTKKKPADLPSIQPAGVPATQAKSPMNRRGLFRVAAAAGAVGAAAAVAGGSSSASAASDGFSVVNPVTLLKQTVAVPAKSTTVVNTGHVGATAAVVNITMANVVQSGFIVAWSGTGTRPDVLTGSWRSSNQDHTVSTTVPLAAGKFSIYNSNGVKIRVDLIGVYGPSVAPPPTTTVPATTVATTTTTIAPTTTPPTSVPPVNATSRPFSSSSLWNTPIPPNQVWSDHVLLHEVPGGINGDVRRHWYVNEGSLKIWWAKADSPLVTFAMPTFIDPTFNRNRPAETFTFRCPANAVPGTDEDKIFVVIDEVSGDYVEVWSATRTGNTVTGGGWARGNIRTGSGMGDLVSQGGNNAGTRAANFSWIGGAITGADLASGKIDHALVIALGYGMLSNTEWRAPATAPDNGGHSGPFTMGCRLGIPPEVARPSGLSPFGNAMWDALKTYGAFVGDFAGTSYPMFYTDSNTVAEANPDIRRLFTWWDGWTADMDIIGQYVRIVGPQP